MLLFLIVGVSSCQKFESFQENDPSYTSEGYFIKTSNSESELNNFRVEKPLPIKQISDIYVDEKYLYVADYAKGMHIFKNPKDAKPEPLLFINIPALRKFTIKDGFIICDNGNDLISFKISGLDLIGNSSQITDAFAANQERGGF